MGDSFDEEVNSHYMNAPLEKVTFFKDKWDQYRVGYLVSNVSGSTLRLVKAGFLDACKRAYVSETMDIIREQGIDWKYDWDKMPSDISHVALPNNSIALEVYAPVPESYALAKQYASALEKELET
ncbi:hypothetical protein COT72_04610 [archaeon CG10_big_fil_rev_8_21_14_0_10_43_11]|nr:MAG: hypothetical protein COT72_04610 [archaeon CG10_big_fil_rev_8_21_14_0_10_43_11]